MTYLINELLRDIYKCNSLQLAFSQRLTGIKSFRKAGEFVE